MINGEINENDFVKKLKKSNTPYQYIQRKYDGHRLNGYSNKLLSREGNEISLPHIKQELDLLFSLIPNKPKEMFFDGEIYEHNTHLNDVATLIAEQNEMLCFYIYDIGIKGMTYEERKNFLEDLFNSCSYVFKYLKLVPTYLVHNIDEINYYFKMFLQEKYEGAVLRIPNAYYEFGKRSSGILKIKPRESSEFKCVGCYSRKKENEITLILETKEGKQFSARIKANTKEREKAKKEFDLKWKDKEITVEYRGFSKDGRPIEAVALQPRINI